MLMAARSATSKPRKKKRISLKVTRRAINIHNRAVFFPTCTICDNSLLCTTNPCINHVIREVNYLYNAVTFSLWSEIVHVVIFLKSRSRWARGQRRRSAAACLLGLLVRIPPWGAWIPVCCECYVLSGRGICDGLVTWSRGVLPNVVCLSAIANPG